MKRKNIRYLIIGIILAVFLIVLWFVFCDRHAPIDEWSESLVTEKMEWAQFGQGYGVEAIRYDLPEGEYETLISHLRTVTEKNCLRKYPENIERIDYRLVIQYDGKLWLFHCYSDNYISITFDTPETAAYYGCEDSKLILRNEAFWSYIVTMVQENAE